MMSSGGRNSTRFPFTAAQWQELEHQALVYKYMVSGMPVPPDLLFTIRRSLDSSLSSKFLLHQPPQHTIGWNSCFQMGFGRKIDPEPGRCRRTDGKKWRCSKEAYPDSKYCERHMHRGRNRSRKPVENNNNNTSSNNMLSPTPSAASATTTTNSPPTAIPISSKRGPIHSSSSPSSQSNTSYLTSASESHFLYPHFSRPPSINLTSQDHTTTNFFLDSNATNYSHPPKDYRDSYGHGMKRETNELGHGYISDQPNANSGTISRTATVQDSVNWHLQAPALTMGSSQQSQMKPHNTNSALHSLNIENTPSFIPQKHDHHHQNYYYHSSSDHHLIDQPKKIMHHFLDDGPGPKDNKDSSPWPQDDKISSQYRTTTQLSISTPNSLHDFFMTQKWYLFFFFFILSSV